MLCDYNYYCNHLTIQVYNLLSKMSIVIKIIMEEGEIMNEQETLEKIARKIRNQKAREWTSKNKDKVREINHRYWLKKAKKHLEEKNKNERGE